MLRLLLHATDRGYMDMYAASSPLLVVSHNSRFNISAIYYANVSLARLKEVIETKKVLVLL